MKVFLRFSVIILVFSAPAWAATYYVCAATGSPCNASDSNAGTSQTATWLHAPGMPNFTGSYTAAAGDKIILRGGDTWHVGNSSATPYTGGTWVFPSAGASGNLIYIGGGQKNWYAGASWVRPVITGDNPVFSGTSYPASCAYDFGTPTIRSLVTIEPVQPARQHRDYRGLLVRGARPGKSRHGQRSGKRSHH